MFVFLFSAMVKNMISQSSLALFFSRVYVFVIDDDNGVFSVIYFSICALWFKAVAVGCFFVDSLNYFSM